MVAVGRSNLGRRAASEPVMFRTMIHPPDDAKAVGERWFAIGQHGLLARADGDRLVLPTREDLAALGADTATAHYLGRLDESDVFATAAPDGPLPGGWSLHGVRTLVASFDELTFALAGRATHVQDWATTNRFCGRCSTPTERASNERCMRCPKCGLSIYPKIAPAVIVLVRKGKQALLARNARFPIPFFSTLAGFSNIGETLEETAMREINEEVGVRVKDLRYFGSQPWPFPNSLMIAFTAEWESGEIVVDGEEIAEAAWFDASALPLVPPALSIARKMIDAWCRETLAPANEIQ